MGLLQITLVAALVACATSSKLEIYKNTLSQSSRIIGGENASRHQFPHQVSLQWGLPTLSIYAHICGGTLINEKWVLTAAHCKAYPFGSYQVVLGLLNQGEEHSDVQTIKVVNFIVHEAYPGGVAPNDIALLELASPAVLSDAVKLATLPKEGHCNALVNTVLSGWGLVKPSIISSPPTTLQWATLPRIPIETCSANLIGLLGEDGPLDETMICTVSNAGQRQSACSGDSGGPLVLYDGDITVIVGVVSWGISPCGTSEEAPSIYTNVCSHLSFINKHVVQ